MGLKQNNFSGFLNEFDNSFKCPCRQLLMFLLLRTIEEASNNRGTIKEADIVKAQEWIFSDKESYISEYAFTFIEVCDYLDLSIEYVRAVAKRLIEENKGIILKSKDKENG